MSLKKSDREIIRQFLINNIPEHPGDIVRIATDQFKISRQAVNNYLNKLVLEQNVIMTGKGAQTQYKMNSTVYHFSLKIGSDIKEEDVFWTQKINPLLNNINKNVLNICQYGFTEIVNNALEHSNAEILDIELKLNLSFIQFSIYDNGVGIFNKISKDFNLGNPRDSILELAKGKFTSDPKSHTGQGIFFTSRMFDHFVITSENLQFYGHKNKDTLFENIIDDIPGTRVIMLIYKTSPVITTDVFDEYAGSQNDFGFTKTRVPVYLLQYQNEELVSRSQARRLLARFEKFREVILDFARINSIGQAFADEVFRVFPSEHPETLINTINTSKEVEKMIHYVSPNRKIDSGNKNIKNVSQWVINSSNTNVSTSSSSLPRFFPGDTSKKF